MDNTVAQSSIVVSSGSSSKQILDTLGSAGNSNNQCEFVNHGLTLWNQTRQQWVGNKRTQTQLDTREPRISWNATYEGLLGTNKPFCKPIPLFEMVDFLVDVWEDEGLYDC